jgi:hypothetical protein
MSQGIVAAHTAPAVHALTVTPSDTATVSSDGRSTRGLFVGTGGNVAVMLRDDSTAVTLKNVASGSVLPIQVQFVMNTNTTATDIVALF